MRVNDGFPGSPAALEARLCSATGARAAKPTERVAQLWSGYGEIRRFVLEGATAPSVIVKQVTPPAKPSHRRGWATTLSHQRKLRSYAVEQRFYAHYAPRCDSACRVPGVLHLAGEAERWLFVLEDLDAAGYPNRRTMPSAQERRACLRWLAHFHARFLGAAPEGLWKQGTYWHLATRPDELAVMRDARLRDAAPALDRRLEAARYRTLVHGDAKLENFCFGAPQQARVAAVDFQYVGGGVGMQDVVYFFSSFLDSKACEQHADALLDVYFAALRDALARLQPHVDAESLEREWRGLYAIAWADFTRFLLGWAPEHAKLHAYSLDQTARALREL